MLANGGEVNFSDAQKSSCHVCFVAREFSKLHARQGLYIKKADGLHHTLNRNQIADSLACSFVVHLAGDQQRLRYHDAHLSAHDFEQNPHSPVVIEILEFTDQVGKGTSGHSDCLPCS